MAGNLFSNVEQSVPHAAPSFVVADESVDTAQIIDAAVTEDKIADAAVTTDKVADEAITGPKVAAGLLHVSLLTGQDGGSDPDYAVTGGAVGDEVVFVGHVTTAASIATLADVTADFDFSDDDVLSDAGETDYSDDQLLVIWIDHT